MTEIILLTDFCYTVLLDRSLAVLFYVIRICNEKL